MKKDDILGGTLKENLARITEAYYQRNGIVEIQPIGKIREEVPLNGPSGQLGSKSSSYYTRELSRLSDSFEWPISVIFIDGDGQRTKQMDIDQESVSIFIQYLEDLQKNL